MAEEATYWLKRRLGRRAVLRAGAAGSSVLVLGLAACSSNKSNSSSSKPAGNTGGNTGANRGLITESTGTPAAVGAQGKPGGSFSFQVSSPPPTLDPYTQTSYLCSYMNGMTYSLLYSFKAGQPGVQPGDSTMEPDLATAMPEQPDKTTFTIKLRPAKFHNVAPTNGRALTSEDVRYAIDRYQNYEKSVHKSFWNWLDSMQTPDPQTIVLKAKFPYADAVQIMGNNLGAYISPKEFAETPDAATKMVGSGPYIHTDYQTGVSLTWKKNPDYYLKPMPYFDEVKAFIVTDTAKRVADFSAKSVNYSWLFLPDERDQLKKNRPDAKSAETQGISSYIYMRTDKPPFNDKRVRQALSMAIDRQAIRQAVSKGEGIDDQALFVGNAGWARQVKDLGDSAKYWTHDVQAAKQLLQAAGVGNLEFNWSHADAAVYTQAYVDISTLTQAQWKDIGVTVKDIQQPYAQYISTTYQGNYDGVGHSPRAVPVYQDGLSDQFYWDKAGNRARINLSYVNDPTLNDLLDKQRAEYDVPSRKKIIMDIESLIAEQQWQIYHSTDTRTYFWDPNLDNVNPSSFFPYRYVMRWWFK